MSYNKAERSMAHYIVMLIMLVMGYEWFVSGIDKLASGHFITGLHNEMMDAIKGGGPYAFYTPFLKAICLPHCIILGGFIQYGEIIIGAGLLIIGIYGLIKGTLPRSISTIGLILAILSLILSFNIFLYAGAKFFFSPEEPFDEGISLDFIMVLMSIVFIIYFAGVNKLQRRLAGKRV